VPLLNTQAQAKAEIQKNTLDKTIVSQLNQKEQLELQLHTLMQTIVFLRKQLALAEQKLKTAQLIVQQERHQYNQGRAGLDDLINAYQTLDTISQARLATMGQLTKNYIEWLRFTDSLIDDNHQITDHGISHD
jgi:outer membrane protein TolC